MIARSLGRQVALAFAIALPASALLVTGLQALRLSPIVAAAGARMSEWGAALGATAVLALDPVAPAAFAVAVVLVVSRWRVDGELLAARAAGVSLLRLATGPLAVAGFAAALLALVSASAAPAAGRRLASVWRELSPRAVVGAVRPGAMIELTPGLLVYAARRGADGTLSDVVVADGDSVLAARMARLRIVRRPTAGLVLEARAGVVRRGAVQARFDRLSLPLAMDAAVDAQRGAIADLAAGPGRSWGALGFAAVAVALVLASLLLAHRPGWQGLVAAALVAARELAARAVPLLPASASMAGWVYAAALVVPILLLAMAARRAAW